MVFLKIKPSLLFLAFIALLSSCVSNKKYVYLQNDDVNARSLPADTIVRDYSYEEFQYKVQPEDILSIRYESLTPKDYDFFSKADEAGAQALSQQVNPLLIGELVDKNGMIPFPVIGKVQVSGLTVYEVQDTLQKIANQYMEDPLVKVRLLNFRITILGEVNQEGTITLFNNRVNMMEAIGLAGGLTDLADKRNIKLIRIKDGRTEVQYINLLDESFLNSPNFFVSQNDMLIVPALRQRPYRKYFTQNFSVIISALTLLVLTYNILNN